MLKRWKTLAALFAALTLLLAACGDDDGTTAQTGETGDTSDESETGDEGPLADQLTLGAPQDCETNPFCIPGLQDVYGVDMSDNFEPLEPGVVFTSLQEGAIDIGVLFSTDGRIADEGWVLLEDDMNMLAADNITPVATTEVADTYGDDLASVLDELSATITTEQLTEMNRRFDIDREDADTIAADFLEDKLPDPVAEVPDGPTITIGAQDFGESAILAQVYGQALEAAGYPVAYQDVGGFRDILLGAFESGDVNFSPEYAASMLEFLNGNAGEATSDAEETVGLLQEQLDEIDLRAFAPAPGVDTNAFVVTSETSEEYGLTKLSDLAG